MIQADISKKLFPYSCSLLLLKCSWLDISSAAMGRCRLLFNSCKRATGSLLCSHPLSLASLTEYFPFCLLVSSLRLEPGNQRDPRSCSFNSCILLLQGKSSRTCHLWPCACSKGTGFLACHRSPLTTLANRLHTFASVLSYSWMSQAF